MTTNPPADGLPDFAFGSEVDAFRWAEERLSRPIAKTVRLGVTKSRSSEYTVWDYMALAETIAASLGEAEGIGRREVGAFRWVYGDADRGRWDAMAAVVADLLAKHEAAHRKSREQLVAVARIALADARYRAVYGERLQRKYYANALGIARQSLADGGWRALIETAEVGIGEWIERAGAALAAKLREKGIL